jgi:hypothetical protein
MCPGATKTEIIGILLYAGIEFWLGRTQKTRAGSLPELLLISISFLAFWAWTKLKTKPEKPGA